MTIWSIRKTTHSKNQNIMKVNTLNLYMGSIYNGKRVGDMTFDEVYRLAHDLIMVKRSCNQVVLLQMVDDAERVVLEFGRKDFLKEE